MLLFKLRYAIINFGRMYRKMSWHTINDTDHMYAYPRTVRGAIHAQIAGLPKSSLSDRHTFIIINFYLKYIVYEYLSPLFS